MLLSKLLLGFLALGCGAYKLLPLLEPPRHDNLIQASLEQSLGLIFRSRKLNTTHVNAIDDKVIPYVFPYEKMPWYRFPGFNKVTKVKFIVHFRTPFVVQSKVTHEDVTHTLEFDHTRGMKYMFRPAELSSPFPQLTESIHSVTAPPGSVVSITLTAWVKNPKYDHFSLRWIAPRRPVLQEHQVPQIVELREASSQRVAWTSLLIPAPLLSKLVNPLGYALMFQSLSSEIIRKFGVVRRNKQKERYFRLIGYFRPRHRFTTLVLSSKAEILAFVHVPESLGTRLRYTVYTLQANSTVVSEFSECMEPDLYYKVEFVGAYRPETYCGFSLMIQNGVVNLFDSPVELHFPDLENRKQKPALAQIENPAVAYDLIDFDSTPSSITLDSSMTGSSYAVPDLIDFGVTPSSVAFDSSMTGLSFENGNSGNLSPEDIAKVSANPSLNELVEGDRVDSADVKATDGLE